jgi:ABC-type transport system involved in Fe-S cluster assembly fused permease/ATPase subunit
VQHVTLDEAISRGTRVVNVPVWLLLATPVVVLVIARKYFHMGMENGRFALALFVLVVVCFVSAWLWWSIAIPRWRLWAYERVEDIPELKRRAVAAMLIWPDGSIFSRTEIKSAAHAQRERELELGKAGSLTIVGGGRDT